MRKFLKITLKACSLFDLDLLKNMRNHLGVTLLYPLFSGDPGTKVMGEFSTKGRIFPPNAQNIF